jgi:hypothetical protein
MCSNNSMKNFAKKPSSGDKGANVGRPILDIKSGKPQKTLFKILFTLAVVALMFVPFLGKAIGAKLSALYLLGNDGKISGRTGGDVYMRNGRKRAFSVPALVRNAYTALARGAFATASSAFRGLSASRIAAWNSFIMFGVDRFGKVFEVKGKTAYVRINANLAIVGGGTLTDPPVTAINPTTPRLLTFETDFGDTTMKIDYATESTNVTVQIRATAPQSAGTSRPSQSKFRDVTIGDFSVAGPIDIYSAYATKFGAPPIGSKVFIQCRAIDATTGLSSAVTAIDCTVVA